MTKPRRADGLTVRVVDGDVLVHDALHEKVHVLNATAGRVLQLCDGAHSAEDIARSLSDATGAALSAVAADVDAIVRDFTRLLLVDERGC